MAAERDREDFTHFDHQSGRTIELIAIDQSYTYEGLLLGVPTTRMNQEMMDELRVRYVRPGEYGVPLLLEPEQRPLDVPPHVQRADTPAELPAVTCIARLMADGLAGTDDIWSVLRVIWFQDEFAFPIAERVLQQIAEIDWEAHATSWEP